MWIIWSILLFIGAIVGLVIFTIVILLILLFKFAGDLSTETAPSESRGPVMYYGPTIEQLEQRWAFHRTGDADLPYAIWLRGSAFRWQLADRVESGPDFYKMFVDGPWKWDVRSRFAGKGINCGHYFGLSLEAATQEAQYYGMDLEKAVLIEVEGESKRILDLTHPEVIKYVFQDFIDSSRNMALFYYPMLQILIEQGKGGNHYTDYIGWYAKRLQYDGILFYSARALEHIAKYRYNRNTESFEYQNEFYEMRKNASLLNVVLFSGMKFVNEIKSIGVGPNNRLQNPHHGVGLEKYLKCSANMGKATKTNRNHRR